MTRRSWLLSIVAGLLLGAFLVQAPVGCRKPEPEPEPKPIPVPTPPVPEPTPEPTPQPEPAPQPPSVAQQLLDAHNAERNRAGVKPLSLNSALTAAAVAHSDHMAKVGRLAHFGIGDGDPRSRASEAGYPSSFVGENAAWNQIDVPGVMRSWMGSSGHRSNILNTAYRDFGAAVSRDSRGSNYWTAVFGARQVGAESGADSVTVVGSLAEDGAYVPSHIAPAK